LRFGEGLGLSDRWQRSGLRKAALALEVPLREYATHEKAAAWFSAALDDLNPEDVRGLSWTMRSQ
jgi:hypothetical protein